ncbi:MAG: hypothetical protein RLZZ565_1406, partial [Planctomycetota bacterium]
MSLGMPLGRAPRARAMAKAWVIVVAGSAGVSCGEPQRGEEPAVDAPPRSVGHAVAGSASGDVPLDQAGHADPPAFDPVGERRAALAAAAERAAAYSRGFKGHALLVMLDGEIVFERYEEGWNASRRHPLASGTKSFVGVLAAAAVEDGLITWEQPVSSLIEEWRDDPRKSRITVRQLLDLSSGLDPADAVLGSGGRGLIGRSIGA